MTNRERFTAAGAVSTLVFVLYAITLSPSAAKRPAHEYPDTVALEGGTFVDLPRSLALWRTYRAPAQVIREGKWVDRPSGDLPLYYAMVGRDLAIALESRGQTAQAAAVIDVARRVAEVVQ